jgi:hypothetical protein
LETANCDCHAGVLAVDIEILQKDEIVCEDEDLPTLGKANNALRHQFPMIVIER